jgi:hypothetical protein
VVRFAARAQQPAALNDAIEATTSEFETYGLGQAMSEFEVPAQPVDADENSDGVTVPEKRPNKEGLPLAEAVEGRTPPSVSRS